MGRPSIEFNPEFADQLCADIAQSEKSLATLLKEAKKRDRHAPGLTTIMVWLRTSESFSQQYAKAKEEQADYLAEQMLEIADDSSQDYAVDENGKAFFNREHVNRSRLRVDTRKWIASKLKPKKYGERIQHANDPDNPLTLTDDQLDARIRELQDKLK